VLGPRQLAATSGAGGIKQLPALQTGDLDEACSRLGAVFRSHSLQFTRKERALAVTHSGFSFGKVSFHRLQYGGYVRMSAPEMGGFYLFQVALTGPFRIVRNQDATDVGERQAYAVNPSETFAKDWVPEGDQLIVRIDRDVLEDYARTVLGSGAARPIVFRPTVVENASDVLKSLAQYAGCVSGLPIRLKRQVEEVAMSTILMSFPSSMSEELARPARACAPYYVRRVEEVIDAAPEAATSLQDMTRIAGVSMRTLYYGFRRFRDTTPLAYLKAKRLDLAKAKLLQADPRSTTVTAVALECGFTHLAKFAADFRLRFGRLPSSVLRFKDQDD
jgi:AraC-like DNA-binding protein